MCQHDSRHRCEKRNVNCRHYVDLWSTVMPPLVRLQPWSRSCVYLVLKLNRICSSRINFLVWHTNRVNNNRISGLTLLGQFPQSSINRQIVCVEERWNREGNVEDDVGVGWLEEFLRGGARSIDSVWWEQETIMGINQEVFRVWTSYETKALGDRRNSSRMRSIDSVWLVWVQEKMRSWREPRTCTRLWIS